MEINGKIVQLLAPQTGQGKNGTWKKQEFILETDGQYPKKVCIAAWGDKFDENLLREGVEVEVGFDVESREYNGRWYTDVKAWKIQRPENASVAAAAPKQAAQTSPAALPPSDFFEADGNGDLPF